MMNERVLQFTTFLDVECGYAENTVKSYALHLDDFMSYLDQQKIRLKRLRNEHVRQYVLYLRDERGNGSKTIRTKLEALRSFLKYLTENLGLFSRCPISDKEFRYKVEKKEAQSISEEQLGTLLEAVGERLREARRALETTTGKKAFWTKRVFAAWRDLVLIMLLVATGLRISEALSIRMGDIDLLDRSIIIHGKGKKMRKVFFDIENLELDLLDYLEQRQNLDVEHDYIFVSIKSYQPLTARGFQVLLKKYLADAALSSRVTPHTLRHSFAGIMIEKGANIKAVSQILGHSNCMITIDLYTHLSDKHLREVMQKCNPLSMEVIPIEERLEMRKKHLAYLDRAG